MKKSLRYLFVLIAIVTPIFGDTLKVGVGKADITPPIGTPSAGYTSRGGEGMEGVRDPLLATALFIDNGDKKVVLCGVDHLGFTSEMTGAIKGKIQARPDLSKCDVYIASSHTHSGGGAYLDIPSLGESLAGAYSAEVTSFYIEKTVEAIFEAADHPIEGQMGIGYGDVQGLSEYRGLWPEGVTPLSDVAVIKVTRLDDSPFAVLFNYPLHPTVFKSQDRQFSPDFVGYARKSLCSLLGEGVVPIYFNGAQGEILPNLSDRQDSLGNCERLGHVLAEEVNRIWKNIQTDRSVHIKVEKDPYSFQLQATPFGLALPIERYASEMNVIVLNRVHAFVTLPGELSCLYDRRLKEFGKDLGFAHVSIFGLTNDAHGYIILPESWRRKTVESALSFGGEDYGEVIESKAKGLLERNAP